MSNHDEYDGAERQRQRQGHPSMMAIDEWDTESIFNPPKPSIQNKPGESRATVTKQPSFFEDDQNTGTSDIARGTNNREGRPGKVRQSMAATETAPQKLTMAARSFSDCCKSSPDSISKRYIRRSYSSPYITFDKRERPVNITISPLTKDNGKGDLKLGSTDIKFKGNETEEATIPHPTREDFQEKQQQQPKKQQREEFDATPLRPREKRENSQGTPAQEDALSIKFSLSHEEDVYASVGKDDSSFSAYLTMESSPKASPISGHFSPPTRSFTDTESLHPSPLQVQGYDLFEFPDGQSSGSPNDHNAGFPLAKVTMQSPPITPPTGNSNSSIRAASHGATPINTYPDNEKVPDSNDLAHVKLESPPDIRKEFRNDKLPGNPWRPGKDHKISSPPRFPLELNDRNNPITSLSQKKQPAEDRGAHPQFIKYVSKKSPPRHHHYSLHHSRHPYSSPDRTIYHVPSKSPRLHISNKSTPTRGTPTRPGLSSPTSPFYPHYWPQPQVSASYSSNSTPSSTHQRSPETPPEYVPPRGRPHIPPRSDPSSSSGKPESNNEVVNRYYHHRPTHHGAAGTLPDTCVTPSPSELRKAVSDESQSPTAPHHNQHHKHSSYYPSRQLGQQPPSAPHLPSSHLRPSPVSSSAGSGSAPYPPNLYGYSSHGWSESLHLAPLPPFVAHQRGAPPPGWPHPPPPSHPSSDSHSHHGHPHSGSTPRGWAGSSHGYYYSSYYHQQAPSSKDHGSSYRSSHSDVHYPPPPDSISAASSSGSPYSTKSHENESTYWRNMHQELHQFKTRYGHCNVPPPSYGGTFSEWEGLSRWAIDQRYQYQRMTRGEPTTMTPSRAETLTSMGFLWGYPHDPSRHYQQGWSGPEGETRQIGNTSSAGTIKSYSSWDKWMELLADYRKEHGNVDVPLKYAANPPLGTFVNRQRTEYRKLQAGKPCSMTEDRVKDLERLGFTWAIRESHTSWEDRFAELKEFKDQNGHCNVPKIYAKNPSLGYWVNEQRFQYRRLMKKKPSYMTKEKMKALNSLEFKWTLRETNGSWDNWMKDLRKYKEQHGDVDVPLKYAPNNALGAFVNRQRTEYRKMQQGLPTSLTEERIHDLNEMGFKWAIRVSRTPWDHRLEELKKFKEEHGHCNVPSTYPKNQPLAYWVFKQRGQYRIYLKGDDLAEGETKQMCHMTPERIEALNAIGFEWNPPRRMK